MQLTKSLAVAWAKDNIQVNAILPGWLHTDLTNGAIQDLPGLSELKGAGLLDSTLPPGFAMPNPDDAPELREDEDPLEDELGEEDETPESDEGEPPR